MGSINDLTGQKFNQLTVIERAEDRVSISGIHHTAWKCLCECGNIVVVRGDQLKNGRTKSCGCLQKEKARQFMYQICGKVTHGCSYDRLLNIWYLMNYRCSNVKCHAYKNYGQRGIRVCNEWQGSTDGYLKFKEWAITHGYKSDLTLERIDVNGDYTPENCTWIPMKDQSKNKRTSIIITHNNQTLPLKEWSSLTGISYRTLHRRLKLGWSICKTIETPVRQSSKA